MRIPLLINNRDLHPKQIVEQCLALDGADVYLIDNGSTYHPTQDYLRDPHPDVGIVWRNATDGRSMYGPAHSMRVDPACPVALNGGPRAACWYVRELRSEWLQNGIRYYATTDSDLDLSTLPGDALQLFTSILESHPELVKTGCALRIDDLPHTPAGIRAKRSEAAYWADEVTTWHKPIGASIYAAPIDTTLAVYRLDPPWDGSYTPAWRIAGPYTARHIPWYHDDANRPADYQYYLDHADPQGTVYTAAEIERRRAG